MNRPTLKDNIAACLRSAHAQWREQRLPLLCLVLASLLSPHVVALKSDADQPIHIEGDDAEIDQSNETIVYTGSVEVVQGTLRVKGDRMIVKISNNQVQRITTTGSPAQYEQVLENNQGEVKARANSIVYHTAQERIYLNGKATLLQQGNELHGESIRYDMVNGKVDASAGQQGRRVRMQLDPSNPPSGE